MKKLLICLMGLGAATLDIVAGQPAETLEQQARDRLMRLLEMQTSRSNELFGYYNDRENHENKQRRNEQRDFSDFIKDKLQKKDRSDRFWRETLDAAIRLIETHINKHKSTARKGYNKSEQINNQHLANLTQFKNQIPRS